jgi:hypothetical protein
LEVDAVGVRTVLRSGGRSIPVGTEIIGASGRRAVAAAARVAMLLGLSDESIERSLKPERIQIPR